MNMFVRRFRLYGVSECNAVAQALDLCLKHWSSEWLGGSVGLTTAVNTPVKSFDGTRKWRRLSDKGFFIAYAVSSGFSRRLAVEAGWCDSGGTRKPSCIWDQTVFDCVDALAKQILLYPASPLKGEA